MNTQENRPKGQRVGALSAPAEVMGSEGQAEPSDAAPVGESRGFQFRLPRLPSDHTGLVPALLCLLLGGLVLGYSAFTWSDGVSSPTRLAGAFLGALLLAVAGSSLRVKDREDDHGRPLMPLEVGLRAAVILALLVVVWLELDFFGRLLGADGFVGKLVPGLLPAAHVAAGAQIPAQAPAAGAVLTVNVAQCAETSWPLAFVLGGLIAAISAILLTTLYTILRFARED